MRPNFDPQVAVFWSYCSIWLVALVILFILFSIFAKTQQSKGGLGIREEQEIEDAIACLKQLGWKDKHAKYAVEQALKQVSRIHAQDIVNVAIKIR